ncbi:MAG TPA: EcsC family protein, partial [Anaerolineales bacterium]|nr:EcsC family protein [Anaerolineales bacterium]
RRFTLKTTFSSDDENLKSQVSKELEEAKTLAKSFEFEKVKNGEWFIALLKQVTKAYDRNARADYFQKKYPGLSADEIADILTSVTVRYATIAGAVAGVAASASEIATLGSAGMTATLFIGAIGTEMIYLSNIQMRLMLDMSVIYDLHLDPEDPEDILMVFGYALGVAPTEILGKGLQTAVRAGTESGIKKVVTKGTREALVKFAQRLGFKIGQKTIIKYAVPVASAAVGSGYNYITTKSVGQIAKLHFKNRGKVTDELKVVISKQNTYDLAIPAAAMFMAQVDGNVSPKEKELYRAMLSRMSFEEHIPAEFQKLISDEQNILDAISQIEDVELRKVLIELLTLMAAYDGVLVNEEREFLINTAERLEVSLDIEQVEKRTKEYQVIVEKNVIERTAGAMGSAAVSVIGTAGQAATKLKDVFGKAVNRDGNDTASTSPNSTSEDPVERLKKLKQMLEAELITQDEFDTKKAEIVSKM